VTAADDEAEAPMSHVVDAAVLVLAITSFRPAPTSRDSLESAT